MKHSEPYDIIGDIHGHAAKLEALLQKLGYDNTRSGWRHSERLAVFIGDFVDRGPEQVRTVNLVRQMVESGAALAVMGNHELNAIAWHTPNPEEPGEFLRPHNNSRWAAHNRKQHEAFLAEVEHNGALHAELVEWFLSLPLWLDLPKIQVVHACWHTRFIDWLAPQLGPGNRLKRELLPAATLEPSDENEKDNGVPSVFKAVEALTKGIEIPLPGGHQFTDKDGKARNRVRIRWWDSNATTYAAAAMLGAAECAALPDSPVPEYARIALNAKPIFFGHYWLRGRPSVQSTRAVCVDYSAGTGGALVAYRYDGESELADSKFVAVN